MALRSAKFLQFCRRVLSLAVNVVMRAKFLRQRFLVFSPRDADRPEAHLHRVLHPEVSQTAEAEHGDQVTGPRAAVPQRVVSRDAGAHQRRGFHGRQIVRHQRQRDGRSEHVVGITAIKGDAGNLQRHLAGKEIAVATGIAMAAMSAVPADAHALARLPLGQRPAPTASTMPITSWPGTRGNCKPGQWPSLTNESLWQMPQAWTLIRTQPAPGCGISRSTISNGPPGRLTWAARIFDIIRSL